MAERPCFRSIIAVPVGIVAPFADLLGEHTDADHHRSLGAEIIRAHRGVCTDGAGTPNDEFQTAHALPLHLRMTEAAETTTMAANLAGLIRDNDGHLSGGAASGCGGEVERRCWPPRWRTASAQRSGLWATAKRGGRSEPHWA